MRLHSTCAGICGVVASLAAVTGATVLRRVRAADAANLEEALQGKPPPNPIIKALRGLIGLVVACLSILVPRSLPSVFLSAASLFFFGVALVVAVPEAQVREFVLHANCKEDEVA